MPVRMLSLKGGGFGGGPTLIGEKNECCASLLAIPRRGVDTRRCVSKDAGPKGGRFGGDPTSIGERNECQRGL